ncbi:MAG: hypothetical protein DRP78_00920 [Candidatus Omnitrophota bacterium]|nr:MAG: hypothetical protein DRP78_00920 [Candidatus Omnitrophota bacterium]
MNTKVVKDGFEDAGEDLMENRNIFSSSILHLGLSALSDYIRTRAYYLWIEGGMPEGQDARILKTAKQEAQKLQKELIKLRIEQVPLEQKKVLKKSFFSRITTLMGKKESLLEKAANSEAQYIELLKRVDDFEKQRHLLSYLDKKNEMLEKEIFNSETEKESLLKRVTILEKDRQKLCFGLKKYKTAELGQPQVNDGLTGQREQKLLQQISALKKMNSALLEKQVNLIQKDTQTDELTVTNTDLKQDMAALKQEIKKLKNRIKKISMDKKKITEEKTKLKQDYKDLSQKVQVFKVQNERLACFEEQKNNLERELAELKDRQQNLLENMGRLENKNKSLKEELNAVGKKQAQENQNALIVAAEAEKILKIKLLKMQKEKEELSLNLNKVQEEQNNLQSKLFVLTEKQNKQVQSYVIDKKKLAEIKEFTLAAIESRRWKGRDFFNGAFEAVGLFYRNVVNENPIKQQ